MAPEAVIAEPTEAVRDYLASVTAVDELVGDEHVYAGELHPDAAGEMPFDCIVISDAGGNGNAGKLPWDKQRIDVRSYGVTPRRAKRVAVTVHLALMALQRRVVGPVFLHSATPSGGYIGLREPGVKPGWPLTLRTYVVDYDQRAVS